VIVEMTRGERITGEEPAAGRASAILPGTLTEDAPRLLSDHRVRIAILSHVADQHEAAIAHAAMTLRDGLERMEGRMEGVAAARSVVAVAEMLAAAVETERAALLDRLRDAAALLRAGVRVETFVPVVEAIGVLEGAIASLESKA
jgi:hypothetical protein